MTDSPVLDDPRADEPLSRRARLQRRVRRQRRHAARDAWIGVAVCALLVGVIQAGYALLPGGWAGAVNDLAGRAGPDVAVAEEAPGAAPGETDGATDAAGDDGGATDAAGDDAVFDAAFVGDVMFARHVEEVAERRGHDALLAHVAPYLEADYVSGNLEQVVSEQDDLPEADKLIHFVTDPRPLDALADAGFTLVTLANNHAMDHGIPGLEDTIAALDAAGLDHVGAGGDLTEAAEIHYDEHEDLTVATIAFSDAYVVGFPARAFQGGVLAADMDDVVRLIQEADAEADLVIAQFHWGDEYDFAPNARQRELAEAAAASGADLVVGHHPHVLMPVERIDDTLVIYSLGNFVFDQGWSRTRETAIARYELGADGTARLVLHPAYIREATPRPVEGPAGVYRRARIFSQLRGDGLAWQRDGDALVTEVDHRHVLEGER